MMELTTDQIERLIELKKRKSYADLAESEFGDRGLAVALRSAIRKYRKVTEFLLPEPEPRLMLPMLMIDYADVLIIGDLHAPYQNHVLLQQAIDLAVSAGIKHVDIAGDLHDFNSLSPLSKGETTTSAEIDIRHSRQILTVLAHYFEQINIMSGNHDEYWIKKKGGSFQDLIYNEVLQGKLSDQIVATEYDYVFRGDKWLIGHLSAYDETPGLIAAKISNRVERNVIVGHDHIFGFQYGEKGYLGVSTGAMLTPDRFWYKQRRLNSFPDFMLGFSLIIDNNLYMFNETGNGSYNGEHRDFQYWKQYFKGNR